MDRAMIELEISENHSTSDNSDSAVFALDDFQLALVGGGYGETILR
jgi:hypothetical protein